MSSPDIPDAVTGLTAGLPAKTREVTHLFPPRTAPANLLEMVHVEADGGFLFTDTEAVGRVALGVAYVRAEDQEDLEQARFYSPIDADLDPDAVDNPPLTAKYPYTELPFGAHFGIVINVPTDKAGVSFSEPEAFGGDSVPGITLFTKFPDANIDLFSDYKVRALKSTRSVVGLLIRNNGHQPVNRRMHILNAGDDLPMVEYTEYLSIPSMRPSKTSPHVALTVVAHRRTEEEGASRADVQDLRFLKRNANQGAAGNAGLTEVIVFTGQETRYTDADLERLPKSEPTPETSALGLRGPNIFDVGLDRTPLRQEISTGLSMGEVGYGKPQRVAVAETVRLDEGSLKVVAAFRFVMVGAGVALAADEQ